MRLTRNFIEIKAFQNVWNNDNDTDNVLKNARDQGFE